MGVGVGREWKTEMKQKESKTEGDVELNQGLCWNHSHTAHGSTETSRDAYDRDDMLLIRERLTETWHEYHLWTFQFRSWSPSSKTLNFFSPWVLGAVGI